MKQKQPAEPPEYEGERCSTAEEVMKRAFQSCRLLLIIGDPGEGKARKRGGKEERKSGKNNL